MSKSSILSTGIVVFLCVTLFCGGAFADRKPRIIATTDGEVDDRCSMVRFLLYANEWDIEGIVISSSKFHWKGHKWAGEKWIDENIDLYAKSYPNLKKHDATFPSPRQLKELVYVGNIDNVGEMGKVKIQNAGKAQTSFVVPRDAAKGDTIHAICEVTDNGTPALTR